jgi:hypothetical protein
MPDQTEAGDEETRGELKQEILKLRKVLAILSRVPGKPGLGGFRGVMKDAFFFTVMVAGVLLWVCIWWVTDGSEKSRYGFLLCYQIDRVCTINMDSTDLECWVFHPAGIKKCGKREKRVKDGIKEGESEEGVKEW